MPDGGGSGGITRQRRRQNERQHPRPSDADFRALVERAGDDCSLCARPLRDGEATAFGYHGATLHLVGECCADRLDVHWGLGIYFAADRTPPWQEDDKAWFAAHPDRSHRLRPAFPREAVQGASAPRWVAVRQLEPGRRQRLGFYPPSGAAPPDIEPLAHALFDVLYTALAGGRSSVPTREILAWAEMLGDGGRA